MKDEGSAQYDVRQYYYCVLLNVGHSSGPDVAYVRTDRWTSHRHHHHHHRLQSMDFEIYCVRADGCVIVDEILARSLN